MGNTVIAHLKDLKDLKDLDGQLIELSMPFQHDVAINDYIDTAIHTCARVQVMLGDQNGPPYIKLGLSVLPLDAKVEQKWSCGYHYYELKE